VSLFRRVVAQEERGVTWPGYPYPPSQFAGRTTAGVNVTLESYTKNVAAGACVRVLVSTVKKLPIDEVRYQGDVRIPLTTQSQIVSSPSGKVSRRAWVAQVMRSLTSAGNVYGDVVAWDLNSMRPTQIETIVPSRASWSLVKGAWTCHIDGKPRTLWPLGDLWHKPASDFLPPGQPFALSPVTESATSIGTGIAAESFGAEFFGDGAHPTQVLKSDDPHLTSEQAEAAKDALIASTRGNRRPLALGASWTLEKNFVDPKDSQFIDLLRFEVEQACRTWGVPPSMVYAAVSGQSVTYANVSQSDLAFLKYSVDNWLVDLEDAWSELIAAPRVVKFNTSALLRMDDTSRWGIHDLRLRLKTTSINDVRKLEDEAPFPDPEFDLPGIPGGPIVPARPEKVAPPAADVTGTAPVEGTVVATPTPGVPAKP
jgi:HK97 family phage portal protein